MFWRICEKNPSVPIRFKTRLQLSYYKPQGLQTQGICAQSFSHYVIQYISISPQVNLSPDPPGTSPASSSQKTVRTKTHFYSWKSLDNCFFLSIIFTYINMKMSVCLSVCSRFSRPFRNRLGYPLGGTRSPSGFGVGV